MWTWGIGRSDREGPDGHVNPRIIAGAARLDGHAHRRPDHIYGMDPKAGAVAAKGEGYT